MGFIFIRPVSGLILCFIALMTCSDITASSVPKRTMLITPFVERTGARFWVVAMAFSNQVRDQGERPTAYVNFWRRW